MEEMAMENTNEIMEDGVEVYEVIESSDNKVLAIAIAAGLAVAGSIGVLVHKNRKKITEWEIKRLQKKGYVVYNPDDEGVEDDCSKES